MKSFGSFSSASLTGVLKGKVSGAAFTCREWCFGGGRCYCFHLFFLVLCGQ